MQPSHADNLAVKDCNENVILRAGAFEPTLGPGQALRGDRHRVVDTAREESKLMDRLGVGGPDRPNLDLG
jgi:hypothetical protein